jgi:hypothetical protein
VPCEGRTARPRPHLSKSGGCIPYELFRRQ